MEDLRKWISENKIQKSNNIDNRTVANNKRKLEEEKERRKGKEARGLELTVSRTLTGLSALHLIFTITTDIQRGSSRVPG